MVALRRRTEPDKGGAKAVIESGVNTSTPIRGGGWRLGRRDTQHGWTAACTEWPPRIARGQTGEAARVMAVLVSTVFVSVGCVRPYAGGRADTPDTVQLTCARRCTTLTTTLTEWASSMSLLSLLSLLWPW